MPTNKFSSVSIPVIIGALVITLSVVVGVVTILRTGNATDLPYIVNSQSAEGVINDELLTMINSIEGIKLEKSIVSNPMFLRLLDLRSPLSEEVVGKTNPFLSN